MGQKALFRNKAHILWLTSILIPQRGTNTSIAFLKLELVQKNLDLENYGLTQGWRQALLLEMNGPPRGRDQVTPIIYRARVPPLQPWLAEEATLNPDVPEHHLS